MTIQLNFKYVTNVELSMFMKGRRRGFTRDLDKKCFVFSAKSTLVSKLFFSKFLPKLIVFMYHPF